MGTAARSTFRYALVRYVPRATPYEVRSFTHLFGSREVTVALFANFVYGFWAVRGVGIVGGGGGCEPCGPFDDRDSWSLRYALVDGVSYGARIVSTDPVTPHASARLRVYPNPTQGPVTVEAAVGSRIVVYDLLGRFVKSEVSTAQRHALDLAGLPAGTYVVRDQASSGIATLVVR